MKLCLRTLCYEGLRLLRDVNAIIDIEPRVSTNLLPLLMDKEEKLAVKAIAI